MTDSVGVTAYTAVNAIGSGIEEIVANLRAGRSGLMSCSLELPFETQCGQVTTALARLPGGLEKFETRTTRLAWSALLQIEPQVRAAVERWGAERVGVVLGSSTAGMLETERAYAYHQQHGRLPDGYSLQHQHSFGGLTEALCEFLGVSGPGLVLSAACASSAKVFGSALRLIQSGRIDAALVGGADSLCQITLRGFHSLGILSAHGCKPFAEARDGISLGEGAALVLLERRHGPGVYVRGVGESSDAHHMSAPDPKGAGARMAIELALQQAGLQANQLDYVNAHGTGTALNDHMEAQVILDLCGPTVPVVSTKGYTGHLLGAAGATEVVFAIIALEQGWLPASLGALPLDPLVKACINTERREQSCRHVLSNSFAFGGSNAAVVLSNLQ